MSDEIRRVLQRNPQFVLDFINTEFLKLEQAYKRIKELEEERGVKAPLSVIDPVKPPIIS